MFSMHKQSAHAVKKHGCVIVVVYVSVRSSVEGWKWLVNWKLAVSSEVVVCIN